jgi:hypothetical protein
MADLQLAPGFHDVLRSRFETPEGKAAIERLISLIVEYAIDVLPADLLASSTTAEGKKALGELWPEIVEAYLRGLSNPRPR